MNMERDFRQLPDDLPVPEDDGAADHLEGMDFPDTRLVLSGGEEAVLKTIMGETGVLFVYPRTGTPGQQLLPGWDDIPGARGCTPQACSYRDNAAAFTALGVKLFGLSAQSREVQDEFRARESIPYDLVSDPELRLAEDPGLPVFETSGLTLYRRLSMVVREGVIEKVFYPVFPPDQDAQNVLSWLEKQG